MEHCFSVVRGLHARFDKVFELSVHQVCVLQVRGGLARETSIMVSPYGALFQFFMRSSGQVRRSLLSVGPVLYKCSIRSLAWLCVLLLYLVAAC